MGTIYLLSSIPGNVTNPESLLEQSLIWITPNLQNLLHIPLFFGLAAAWRYGLKKHIRNESLLLAAAFILSVLYGFVDELHQMQVPGRYGSISDIGLDALGAALILITPLTKKLYDKKDD